MKKKAYIYACTRPEHVSYKDHPDCTRCKVARCGYSLCFESNEKWEEQGGICRYEHCIENMPYTQGPASCPIFGHDCPDGVSGAEACRRELGSTRN